MPGCCCCCCCCVCVCAIRLISVQDCQHYAGIAGLFQKDEPPSDAAATPVRCDVRHSSSPPPPSISIANILVSSRSQCLASLCCVRLCIVLTARPPSIQVACLLFVPLISSLPACSVSMQPNGPVHSQAHQRLLLNGLAVQVKCRVVRCEECQVCAAPLCCSSLSLLHSDGSCGHETRQLLYRRRVACVNPSAKCNNRVDQVRWFWLVFQSLIGLPCRSTRRPNFTTNLCTIVLCSTARPWTLPSCNASPPLILSTRLPALTTLHLPSSLSLFKKLYDHVEKVITGSAYHNVNLAQVLSYYKHQSEPVLPSK